MGIDDEIQKEFLKMKNDSLVDEITTINAKTKFADSLLNGDIGTELKNCNMYYLQTKPLKIPFKIKFKNFIDRLKNILWN